MSRWSRPAQQHKQMRDGVCAVTVQNISRVLSSFYAWMFSEEYMPRNPMLKVGKIKIRKKHKDAFSDMEIEKIRSACRSSRETAIIETLLSTGCRVSELASIRRDEINGDEVLVHGKGEKDRIVYLNAKAMLALDRYLAERLDRNPYVFPRSTANAQNNAMCNYLPPSEMRNWYAYPELVDANGAQDKSSIESVVRKIGKRAGVDRVHPHRFRRTCATMALRHGMPVELVSKMLGHESIATTQIYLDIGEDSLKNAHKKFIV